MATTLFEDSLEIPDGIRTLADSRRWTHSDEFPKRGRIDYINGRIQIDMSPETLYSHGKLKVMIASVLYQLTVESGDVFSDRTRIVSADGDVSAEPDVVYLSHDAIRSGRVRLVEAAGDIEDYVEIQGPPDLIVEIVNDGSVTKDTKRLPPAYFAAGVPEFWQIDARRDKRIFRVHKRGKDNYVPQRTDREGYQRSVKVGGRFRLERRRDVLNHRQFSLLHAE
jgi:Uma2 family endonuclease